MGLKITLKPSEKMIVGNSVISNSGNADCQIMVENDSTILREKNIMSEEGVDTPCKQIYFIVQLMYIDQVNLAHHQTNYWKIVKQVIQAAPSTMPIIHEMNHHILKEEYYQALRVGKKLIDYEAEILNTFIASSLKIPNEHPAELAASTV